MTTTAPLPAYTNKTRHPQARHLASPVMVAFMLLLLLISSIAQADPPNCRKKYEAYLQQSTSLSAFMAQETACLEATNGCSQCTRAPDMSISCTTPRLDCTRSAIHCTRASELDYTALISNGSE
ncbi:hypothetical protein SAMN04515647_4026 [Cohaesibacter sp. ES.047]|uniref:hypothetical protein n=1 Tax=Cohaesibacter sp. ES.047 TaxID=1798205 RepID=UPI000BBF4000|nr:hypothetical protein [Cohaesibacter sp. ES.047]SNY93714.1 hypothetical protein SAMN04515647_4026 [Cohaesibacter sp. ES.047]